MKHITRTSLLVVLLLSLLLLVACQSNDTIKLSVEVIGEGTVTPSPGIYTYEEPTRLTFTAEATDIDWVFVRWEGAVGEVSDNEISFLLTDDTQLLAVFERLPNDFDVTFSIIGEGTIHPIDETVTIERHQTLEIEAIPDPGWRFLRWEGFVAEPLCARTSLLPNHAQEVIAVFEPYRDVGLYLFDSEERLDHVDLGLWLDGFAGTSHTYILRNHEDRPFEIEIVLEGEHNDLFEVSLEDNIIESNAETVLSIRYLGERDPEELGVKRSDLVLIIDECRHTIILEAEPVIDEIWALHALMTLDIDGLNQMIARFKERPYAEAHLALGILYTHLFALAPEADRQEIADAAYDALMESDLESDLNTVYKGVSASFIAQTLGATGGSYIELFQDILIDLEPADLSWFLNYWRGMTLLRTADGVLNDFFARMFYGARATELWIPAGEASLDLVFDHAQEQRMHPDESFDGFVYDRTLMPVPDRIYKDIGEAPRYTPTP
jgi:hypothetical protein